MKEVMWKKPSKDRRYFIGGSDVRIIVGDDEAALRLWREKRGEMNRRTCPAISPAPGRNRRPNGDNGRMDSKPPSLAVRTPLPRPEKPAATISNTKARTAVRFDMAASAHLRDVMVGELNQIGSEGEAAKWAHARKEQA